MRTPSLSRLQIEPVTQTTANKETQQAVVTWLLQQAIMLPDGNKYKTAIQQMLVTQ
jgi:hypothetical protein